jgi:hypothetical protein
MALPLNRGWCEFTAASTASATIADFTAVIAAVQPMSDRAGGRAAAVVLTHACSSIGHRLHGARLAASRYDGVARAMRVSARKNFLGDATLQSPRLGPVSATLPQARPVIQ